MSKTTETRTARIASAKLARAEALAAHRAALAAVREAKSEANREAHRTRPVRVSASATRAVTGAPLADGATAKGTVTPEHVAKYVSLAPLAGKRATFARIGDAFTASVPTGKSTAGTKLASATRVEASAAKRLSSARATLKRVSAVPRKRVQATA